MATKKISALTELTTPAGTEELIVNAGGTSKKITQTNLLSTALPKAGGTMTGTIADFTSTGIDDNATSTAITIDASEDVLIGQTTSNFATTGIRLRSSAGQMTATRSGGAPLAVNRLTSDGAILDFNSAGTNVGSVSVTGTGTTYSTGSTGGIDFSATSDGSGTMTSEVLDDYEEGTFTCTLTPSTSGSITLNTSYDTLSYTKIGRVVHIGGRINIASVSSPVGNATLNLPFTIATLTKHSDYHSIRLTCHSLAMNANGIGLFGETSGGGATYNIAEERRNANWVAYDAASIVGDGSDWIIFDGTYTAA